MGQKCGSRIQPHMVRWGNGWRVESPWWWRMSGKGLANDGAVITDATLLLSKGGVKSLALVLTPKETMTIAHFHQMHSASDFLAWIQIQQLDEILHLTQPVPKHCSTGKNGKQQARSTIIKAQELRISNSQLALPDKLTWLLFISSWATLLWPRKSALPSWCFSVWPLNLYLLKKIVIVMLKSQ